MKPFILAVIIIAIVMSIFGCSSTPQDIKQELPTVETKVVGVANVARQGYAMGGSAIHGNNIYANDGDLSTYYCSNTSKYTDYGEYLFVDLTEVYNIRNIVLYEAANADQPFLSDIIISISDDGIEWTETLTVNNVKSGEEIALDGVKARFVKVAPVDKSQNFSIAEIEINADVDNKHNLILNYSSMRLYDDSTPTLAVKNVRIGDSGKQSFYTSDPNIATIDESGNVKVTGFGKCNLYVYDGNNLATCTVDVIDDNEETLMASLFYHSEFCHPGEMFKALDLASESGADYIEETCTYDDVNNIITDYCLFLCAERGLLYQVSDIIHGYDIIYLNDEELEMLISKYEYKSGFGGIYTRDEPDPNAEPIFAELICRIAELNPHITAGFNILPSNSRMKLLGKNLQFCNGIKQYVSTDYYPFVRSGFRQGSLMDVLETLRTTAIQYDVRTALYLQASESDDTRLSFYMPEDYEFRFQTFLSMSYGLKNYKWFLYYTPNERNNEGFTRAMLDKDYNTTPIYDRVKDCNEMIHKFSPYLADTQSFEIYVTPKYIEYKTEIPQTFPIRQIGEDLTIYVAHHLGRSGEYYSILRDCQIEGKSNVSFEITNGASDIWILRDNSNEWEKIAVLDGKITIETDRGSFALISFTEKSN